MVFANNYRFLSWIELFINSEEHVVTACHMVDQVQSGLGFLHLVAKLTFEQALIHPIVHLQNPKYIRN